MISVKPEFGGSTEVMDGRSSVPEGFDPNARVEVCENLQQSEAATAATDVQERAQRGDAVEANGNSFDVDSPEPEHDGTEGDSALDELFSKIENLFDDLYGSHERESWDWVDYLYTTPEQRVAFAKCTDAELRGGDDYFTMAPNVETTAGKAAYDRMQEFDVSEIHYVKGVVDFAPVSVAQTTIEGMTSDLRANKMLGFEAFAQQFNKERPLPNGEKWDEEKVKEFAKENNLEFHECSDMRTIQLVPAEIHRFFKHFGGRAECRIRDGEKTGDNGGFDD